MLGVNDLHPYQHRVIGELYERLEVLALVPMGGGKTVSALTAFSELQRDGLVRRGIVLAPKRIVGSVWPQEPTEWEHLRHLNVVPVVGPPDKRERLLGGDADLYLVGVDNTQWLVDQMSDWPEDDPRLDLLIIDELSRYKAPTGKRARAMSMVAGRFRARWGLTGTPRPNNELDLFQPMRIITARKLWPEHFDEWREQYFKPENSYTRLAWTIRPEWKDKILGDVEPYTVVVGAEELPPQPELVPVVHWVDLPKKARAVYDRMERHMVVELGEHAETVFAENAAVVAGKLDQIAQGFLYTENDAGEQVVEPLHDAKMAMLRDLLDGLDEQVMITYWFQHDLKMLRENIPDLAVLGSGISAADTQAAVDGWNAGTIRRLAVHPASAGHGLNLQKSSATQIIHYCPTWSAELFDQVTRRIARQGSEAPRVMNHLIVSRETLDEVKVARVRDKVSAQQAFLDYMAQRT